MSSYPTSDPITFERNLSDHLQRHLEIDVGMAGRFDRALTPPDSDTSSQAGTENNHSSRPSFSKSSAEYDRPSSSLFSEHDHTAVNSQDGDHEADKYIKDEELGVQLERINSMMAEKVNHLPHHKSHDPDLVDWDGPHDPENPQNFSFRRKVALTALIIVLTVNV
jgi:hypothetical protein